MSARDYLDKDFYAVLGVTKAASADEIKKSYRKLARQFHPDANGGDPKAEEKFKVISEAYDVLSDDTKRQEYDEMRQYGGSFGGGVPGGFGSGNTSREASLRVYNGRLIPAAVATRRSLPSLPGDGVRIELFNQIGAAPTLRTHLNGNKRSSC